MPGPPLLDRRLLFVTGKGGVGKTTVAAALALLAAEHGKRTLVGEVDAKGNLADFYEVPPTKFEPRELFPNLLVNIDFQFRGNPQGNRDREVDRLAVKAARLFAALNRQLDFVASTERHGTIHLPHCMLDSASLASFRLNVERRAKFCETSGLRES